MEEATIDIPAGDLVLTIEEAARVLRVGRTTMYALIATGDIESVCIGRLRRIPVRCLHRYVDSLLDVDRAA